MKYIIKVSLNAPEGLKWTSKGKNNLVCDQNGSKVYSSSPGGRPTKPNLEEFLLLALARSETYEYTWARARRDQVCRILMHLFTFCNTRSNG